MTHAHARTQATPARAPDHASKKCTRMHQGTHLHARARAHAGDPRASAKVWDTSLQALAPLRALLASACGLFPAASGPYLRLLRAFAHGPAAAEAAYAHLGVRESSHWINWGSIGEAQL